MIADDIDLGDLSFCEAEANDTEEMSSWSDDETDSAIDESGARCSCTLSVLDGVAWPEL